MSLSCNKTDRSAELAPPMGDTSWQRCIGIAIFLFPLFNFWWTDAGQVLHAAPISVDSLEGPTTSWSLGETDSTIQVLEHSRVRRPVHSGRWSEKFYLTSHGGSFVYATTPIEMAAVIEELSFSLWIRANRPGMQLAARVVLPRSIDPETGEALTLKIYGDSYQNVGRWQQVFLDQVMQKVRRQTRIAQTGHSGTVDFREAYVDRIMINLHGGNGKTLAYIDDLTSHSLISRQDDSGTLSVDRFESTRFPPAPQRSRYGDRNGPSVPQTIQYQGEPFAFLKKLGFNSILLSSPPTEHQCRDASKHQLWLLAPATDTMGVSPQPSRATGLQPFPADLIWHAPTDDAHPAAQNFEAPSDLNSRTTTNSGPFALGKIDTQISANSAYPLPLQETFDSVPAPRVDLCYWEIREQVLRTMMAGKQQFFFTSRHPLNDPHPSALRRSKALRLILMELDILQPFLSGNVNVQAIVRRDSDIKSTLLKKNRSALFISKAPGLYGTFLCRPIFESYDVTVPNIPATSRVFFIRPFDLRPAHRQRVAGGIQVKVQKPDQLAIILLTNHLPQIRRTANQIAEARDEAHEVLDWLLEEEIRLHRATFENLRNLQISSPTGQIALEQMKGNPALLGDTGSRHAGHRGSEKTLKSFQQLRSAQWKLWHRIVTILGPPTRHPALARFHSLPAAIIWADISSRAPLGPDLLTKQMNERVAETSSGWFIMGAPRMGPQKGFEVQRHSDQSETTLHLWSQQETSATGSKGLLSIESPRMHLPPGQPYLIQADVMVDAPEKANTSRVLIFDTGEGFAMGQSLRPGKKLQQCILYRRSPPAGYFSVCIAIRGLAEVWIKNITIRPLTEVNIAPEDGDLPILANPGGR